MKRSTLLTLSAISLLFIGLGTTVFRTTFLGDEGYYGSQALNILHSLDYLLHPSYIPEGDFYETRHTLAHPPIFSALLALFAWPFGGNIVAFQLLPLLSFATVLFVLHQLIEGKAGTYAVLLLAFSVPITATYGILEAEPVMVGLGFLAILCINRQRTLLGGLCLGLGFAMKLWLLFPFVLAACCVIKPRQIGRCILGMVIPPGLHLASIAIVHPEDLSYWIQDIYFGLFTGQGVSGNKIAGLDNHLASWKHPFWYYFAILYREHYLIVPLLLLGVGYIRKLPRWMLVGASSLLLLSVPAIKEPLYVLSCFTFLYGVAAISLAFATDKTPPKWQLRSVQGVTAFFGMAIIACFSLGKKADDITPLYTISHTLACFGIILFLECLIQKRLRPALAALSTSYVLVFAINQVLPDPQSDDRLIANSIAEAVQNTSPSQLTIIAPNFKSLQLHLFRRGQYWRETPLPEDKREIIPHFQSLGVRALIFTPEILQKPELAELHEALSEASHPEGPLRHKKLPAASVFILAK